MITASGGIAEFFRASCTYVLYLRPFIMHILRSAQDSLQFYVITTDEPRKSTNSFSVFKMRPAHDILYIGVCMYVLRFNRKYYVFHKVLSFLELFKPNKSVCYNIQLTLLSPCNQPKYVTVDFLLTCYLPPLLFLNLNCLLFWRLHPSMPFMVLGILYYSRV